MFRSTESFLDSRVLGQVLYIVHASTILADLDAGLFGGAEPKAWSKLHPV
jgi:hypothetical protein